MRTLIIATLLCPAIALAGGTSTPNQDPRSLALAQAGIASLTGPEAITMNGAAMAGQKGFAIGGALQVIANQTTWTDAGASATTESHPSFPPLLAITYGGDVGGRAWGAGIGFNAYGGGSLYWPDGWPGQYHIQDVTQQIVTFRAGGAIEALKGVKFGANFVYVRATEELSQATGFPDSMAKVGAAGGAPGWEVSTEIKIPEVPLKFGADYRSKSEPTLKGSAHFTNVPPPYQTLLQDQNATTNMVVPAELNVGLSWKATGHLELMAAFTYEWWSAWKSDVFTGDKGFTVTVPRNYNDAQIYRLGVEYAGDPSLKGFTLRGGVMRSISEQPTDTISPSLSDASSWNGSVGVGYQVSKGLSVDAAYQYAKFDKVTASGTEAFPGSYETTAHLVSVGFTWRL